MPGPVYWAGPRAGVRYEVTRTDDGTVYVRYLPAGVEPGDPRTGLLTVATYPHVNALEDVQAAAERPGAVSIPMELGAAVHDADSSGNVHLAFPDEDVQIEVYGADSDDVAALVRGGRIDAVR